MQLQKGYIKRTNKQWMLVSLMNGKDRWVKKMPEFEFGDPVLVAWNHHENKIQAVYTVDQAKRKNMFVPDMKRVEELGYNETQHMDVERY